MPIEETITLVGDVQTGMTGSQMKSVKCREIAESLAILSRRSGDLEKAIDLYINVLIELSKAEIVSALYISNGEVPFDPMAGQHLVNQANVKIDANKAHLQKFDSLVMDIVRICEKSGGTEEQQETLWLHAIRQLYKVRLEVFNEDGKASAEKKEKKDHKRFATFHMIRVQFFMSRMAEHVSIPKIIQFLEDMN